MIDIEDLPDPNALLVQKMFAAKLADGSLDWTTSTVLATVLLVGLSVNAATLTKDVETDLVVARLGIQTFTFRFLNDCVRVEIREVLPEGTVVH